VSERGNLWHEMLKLTSLLVKFEIMLCLRSTCRQRRTDFTSFPGSLKVCFANKEYVVLSADLSSLIQIGNSELGRGNKPTFGETCFYISNKHKHVDLQVISHPSDLGTPGLQEMYRSIVNQFAGRIRRFREKTICRFSDSESAQDD
jgi:hypothetical protein